MSSIQQDILRDDCNGKRSLISESVMAIRIDVHPTGKNLTNTSYAWPLGSHVRQPSVKSLLIRNWAPAPGRKSWPPAIARPGRRPGAASFSLQQTTSKQGGTIPESSYWATRFTRPHKPGMRSVQIKDCPSGPKRCGP
jgi:hypothetical protein